MTGKWAEFKNKCPNSCHKINISLIAMVVGLQRKLPMKHSSSPEALGSSLPQVWAGPGIGFHHYNIAKIVPIQLWARCGRLGNSCFYTLGTLPPPNFIPAQNERNHREKEGVPLLLSGRSWVKAAEPPIRAQPVLRTRGEWSRFIM